MPLHPFIEAMLAQMAAAGRPALSAGSPENARAMLAAGRAALGPRAAAGSVRDVPVPTRSGGIAARLVMPQGTAAGLIVYLHGGGWVLGAIDDFDVLAHALAAKSGCAVLLPDYRLAPEFPFPAGLEDAEDTLMFAVREIAALCGRDVPVVVAGDSAGANLATVAARRLRGRVDLALQVLAYPVTDADPGRDSYRRHGTGLPLTRTDMDWFFGLYVPAGRRSDPDVSPLRAPDLSGLPPALVLLAEYDVLHDEGEAYAQAMARAGVPVTLRRLDGLTHGFLRLHNHVGDVDRVLDEVAAAIRTAVGRRADEPEDRPEPVAGRTAP